MIALKFDGFIESEGSLSSFTADISGPHITSEKDYFYEVHAPFFFAQNKKIYGADGEQAKRLAVQFLISLIGPRHLYDSQSKRVEPENEWTKHI